MKALSIREPWATLIYDGRKTIETRTWQTKHRGKILLCASKKPHTNLSGKAFAIVELVDCRPMEKQDEDKACCELYDGAFSWVFANIRNIEPFQVKGQLGLFDVDEYYFKTLDKINQEIKNDKRSFWESFFDL